MKQCIVITRQLPNMQVVPSMVYQMPVDAVDELFNWAVMDEQARFEFCEHVCYLHKKEFTDQFKEFENAKFEWFLVPLV